MGAIGWGLAAWTLLAGETVVTLQNLDLHAIAEVVLQTPKGTACRLDVGLIAQTDDEVLIDYVRVVCPNVPRVSAGVSASAVSPR